MREVFPRLREALAAGEPFAVATVVRVEGSAPRAVGASLVVTGDGAVAGGVSGGCVEAAVHELCRQALADGRARTERFGTSEDPFAVGLTCGGTLEVLVRPVTAQGVDALRRAVEAEAAGRAAVLVTLVSPVSSAGPEWLGRTLLLDEDGVTGSLGSADLDGAAARAAERALRTGRDGVLPLERAGAHDGAEVLVEVVAPPPRMLVFGAVDPAAALTRMGGFLGYRVTVCDARALFATRARFPEADEVVVRWPAEYLRTTAVDERTVVCVLTHDEKFDVPLLEVALRGPAGFVGALGSRRTHEDRSARLLARGLSPAELERLSSPIGLDLGACTPEETAVAIVAEVVAQRRGGSGARLSRTTGPIHRPRGDRAAVRCAS